MRAGYLGVKAGRARGQRIPLAAGHRFWRLYIATVGSGSGAETRVGEVRLWTGADGTGTNVGLNSSGSTWTADSAQASHDAAFAGDNAINAWWSAAAAAPHWLLCDLGAGRAADVKSLELYQPSSTIYGPKDFKLQWSDDGTTFTDVLTVNLAGGLVQTTFTPGTIYNVPQGA